MAAVATTNDRRETTRSGGLSEWWSEETEHVFRRIERWTALARGYGRLRSSRTWSRTDRQRELVRQNSSSSSGSCRKPPTRVVVAGGTADAPRFRGRDETRSGSGRSRSAVEEEMEEARIINCRGRAFSCYQSNGELDSDCLEAYRYDHSIFFKTVGDIRDDRRDADGTIGGRREDEDDAMSIGSEDLVEWEASSVGSLADLLANAPAISVETPRRHCLRRCPADTSGESGSGDRVARNVWPIVDLTRLNLNLRTIDASDDRDADKRTQRGEREENNNAGSPETRKGEEAREKDRESTKTGFRTLL